MPTRLDGPAVARSTTMPLRSDVLESTISGKYRAISVEPTRSMPRSVCSAPSLAAPDLSRAALRVTNCMMHEHVRRMATSPAMCRP
eukprot:6123861-Prymnesium_polylepis.1